MKSTTPRKQPRTPPSQRASISRCALLSRAREGRAAGHKEADEAGELELLVGTDGEAMLEIGEGGDEPGLS